MPTAPAATYTVRSGDTLSAIARRHNTSVSALAKLNGLADPNKLRAGQVLKLVDQFEGPSRPYTSSYEVKAGDTLSKIARAHGVTVSELAGMNGIANPNKLSVGMDLKVPSLPAAPAKATAARADAQGRIFATVAGKERLIGTGGRAPVVAPGGRYVAFIHHAELGQAQKLSVYDVQTGKTKALSVDADQLHGLRAHATSDGQIALLAEGISGPRGVPVLGVLHPAKGSVWSGVATLQSVAGNSLKVQLWDRREGEYEVSPVRSETHDLRALLQR